MVVISSEKDKLHPNAIRFTLIAYISHEDACRICGCINGKGHGYITTAYKDDFDYYELFEKKGKGHGYITTAYKDDFDYYELFEKKGKGHGYIITAYKDYTIISLSDSDPNFSRHLIKIIRDCTRLETTKLNDLEIKIHNLQKMKYALEEVIKGELSR
jgi:hypothetical protein